jgi:hypothetical protein
MKMPEMPEMPRELWAQLSAEAEVMVEEYALAYGNAVREECARIAEEEGDGLRLGDSKTAQDIADAIRKD